MGVVEAHGRQAAQHATEYAPPNHILGAGGWRRFSDRGEAARAQDEDPVVTGQDESSCWLWVVPRLPQARQSAGGAGSGEPGADGTHTGQAQPRVTNGLFRGLLTGTGLGL